MRQSARTPAALLCALVAVAAVTLTGTAAGAAAALGGHPSIAALPPPVLPTPATTCPDQVAPPSAIDASEKPSPGQSAPPPVPEPASPAGGPRMAECNYVLPPGAPPLPLDLGFESWVLQDLDSGAVLAARDPHARQRPASLIKLLLAQVVVRELDPNRPVVGTQDDADQQGTRVGIGPGGQYTVGLLLHGLLMASGNDIAHALAVQLGGVQVAVEKMNALAHQLGMADTRAASPSGLDAPGMSTSAYDLSIIFRTDLANPLIADAVHTAQLAFPGYGAKPGFVVNNDNQLLRDYPGDLGGKTGYTDDAQQTYANAAARNGHRIALVMTHGTNHLSGRWQNARELMDYGFTLENLRSAPVGQLVSAITAANTPADGVAKQIPPTGGHGGAGVAAVPSTSMTTFGNVGGPLTVLAGVALVLIGLLYLKRRRAKAARAARARAVASAATVRVAAVAPPTEPTPTARVVGRPGSAARGGDGETEVIDAVGPAVNGSANGARPAAARTQVVRPVNGSPRPATNGAATNGGGAGNVNGSVNGSTNGSGARSGAAPEWPASAPEWPQ